MQSLSLENILIYFTYSCICTAIYPLQTLFVALSSTERVSSAICGQKITTFSELSFHDLQFSCRGLICSKAYYQKYLVSGKKLSIFESFFFLTVELHSSTITVGVVLEARFVHRIRQNVFECTFCSSLNTNFNVIFLLR